MIKQHTIARYAGMLAILSAIAVFGSCAKPKTIEATPTRVIRAVAAEQRDLNLSIEYSARVQAAKEIAITPKVGGRVTSVRANVGDRVARGQILFTLDSTDYDAQYRQAQAAYGSAEANLTRTNDAGQSQQMIQAQSGVDQAQVAYDQIESLRNKTADLFANGAVAKQQLDDVEAKLKGAGIQLEAAKQALALIRDKSGKQSSDIVSGQVDQAKAQTDLAKSQLEGTIIRSPIDGLVSYRNAESGVFVGTSTVAFMVIDDSFMIADVPVSQLLVGLVKPNMKIQASVGSPLNENFESIVEWISPGTDPRTQLYALRIKFLDSGRKLKPGMIARLMIPSGKVEAAILVPEQAIFSVTGGDAVYVMTDGKVTLRRIELGESDGSDVAVMSGLKKGEIVVTEGQEFLKDGDPVQLP